MFTLPITSMLTTIIFNSQPILRLILLNVSTEFDTVDHFPLFDMLSSLGLQDTTLTGCSCSTSCHTFIFTFVLNVADFQDPLEKVLRHFIY